MAYVQGIKLEQPYVPKYCLEACSVQRMRTDTPDWLLCDAYVWCNENYYDVMLTGYIVELDTRVHSLYSTSNTFMQLYVITSKNHIVDAEFAFR